MATQKRGMIKTCQVESWSSTDRCADHCPWTMAFGAQAMLHSFCFAQKLRALSSFCFEHSRCSSDSQRKMLFGRRPILLSLKLPSLSLPFSRGLQPPADLLVYCSSSTLCIAGSPRLNRGRDGGSLRGIGCRLCFVAGRPEGPLRLFKRCSQVLPRIVWPWEVRVEVECAGDGGVVKNYP